jgi:hypothetical protein
MAAGIGVGKVLHISDFTLTAPIEALKAIAAGTFELTVPQLPGLRPRSANDLSDDQRGPARD